MKIYLHRSFVSLKRGGEYNIFNYNSRNKLMKRQKKGERFVTEQKSEA